MKALGLIALGLCCIAAPLTAQQDTSHARRPMRRPRAGQRAMASGGMEMDSSMLAMMHDMMGPMMGVMAYEPGRLLAHKDSLQLTSDQVSKLTAIDDSAKSARDAAMNDVKTHMGALSQAFQTASPDTGTLHTHFTEAQAAMAKAHWAMLSAAAQARAILTDAQRSKVDAAVSAMEQRMQQRMEGREQRRP
jgi:hypothetical protein